MAQVVLVLSPIRCGNIALHANGSYSAATGNDQANVYVDTSPTTGRNQEAVFCFDGSGIPEAAVIVQVDFLPILADSQPQGAPKTGILQFCLGTWIGPTIDPSAGDYDAGYVHSTLVHITGRVLPNGEWMELGNFNDPCPLIVPGQQIDLRIYDGSIQGTGDPTWGTYLNSRSSLCQLRITFESIQGTATATGLGTAEITTRLTATGSATMTGRGAAECMPELEQPGTTSGEATGRGWASCRAEVYQPVPFARHFAIRVTPRRHHSVRSAPWRQSRETACSAVSSAARTCPAVAEASRSCPVRDLRTCSARRN